MQHELGHAWFNRTFGNQKALFGPGRPISSHGPHSGPAHDWLNETAAILLENDQLTADRRHQFADAVKVSPSPLRPLTEFFTMEHPSAPGMGARKPPKGSRKPGDIGVSIELAPPASDKGSEAAGLGFYTQCRGFIDFLIKRTKDEQIFRKIAEVETKGGDMASWLAADGAKYGLPGTVAQLDEEFHQSFSSRPAAPTEGIKHAALGVSLDAGAVIQAVMPDSGAANAGLQVGDAISGVDGQPVKQPQTLPRSCPISPPATRSA